MVKDQDNRRFTTINVSQEYRISRFEKNIQHTFLDAKYSIPLAT